MLTVHPPITEAKVVLCQDLHSLLTMLAKSVPFKSILHRNEKFG